MSPGDRPSIPLEAEPIAWLHAAGLGTVAPGAVQPVERVPALEEEPAQSVDPPAPRLPTPRRRPAVATRPDPSAPVLPATGPHGGWAIGAGLVGLAWALRRRQSAPRDPGRSFPS